MMTRARAQGLMGLIPDKVSASVALQSDNASATTVVCPGAWWKPLKSGSTTYSGYALTGTETLLNIPDSELNPAANGRVIKPDDEITVAGTVYIVQVATLKSLRTRWECLVNNRF